MSCSLVLRLQEGASPTLQTTTHLRPMKTLEFRLKIRKARTTLLYNNVMMTMAMMMIYKGDHDNDSDDIESDNDKRDNDDDRAALGPII